MQLPKTVILNCAGLGSRLGMGKTKALINLDGKPLIHWQLDMLADVKDVRVVVGFEAQEVIDTVLSVRRDVLFVFNHNYHITKTGASLALGAAHTNNFVISLDGDLLVHPQDFQHFLSMHEECVGYTEINTEQPCYVTIQHQNKNTYATEFMPQKKSNYEWNGLVQIHASKITPTTSHVYEILLPHLPLPAIKMRTQEIDTLNDYQKAQRWLKEVYPITHKEHYARQTQSRTILEETY
jgi:choline kinase